MPIRALIIEDEPAIARNLAFAISQVDADIQILAMLDSVKDSVEWLNTHTCDLLFMDIQLADGRSFDIFQQVTIDTPVIFITAYDQFAIEAFKANGIDYLLKPFDQEELSLAIAKFKRLRPTPALPDLSAIINTLQVSRFQQSFLLHYQSKLIPIKATQLQWIYAKDETVRGMVLPNKFYPMEHSLEQLEQLLDPQSFFRANRQFIVNRSAIQEIEFYFNGRLFLKTLPEAPEAILISKAKAPLFKQWMNN